MNAPDEPNNTISYPLNNQLYRIIRDYQQTHKLRQCTESEEYKASLYQKEKDLAQELWVLIGDEFIQRVARDQFMRNSHTMRELRANYDAKIGMQDPITSLALHNFFYILKNLHTLPVNPDKNILNLLWKVSKYGMIDEYRTVYKRDTRRRKKPPDSNPPPNSIDAQAWFPRWRRTTTLASLSDQDNTHRIISLLHLRECWAVIEPFLSQLKEVNQQVIKMRYEEQLPFKDIAKRLEWNISRVMMCHQRSLKQIKRLLQKHNLLDEDEGN